MTTHQAPAQMLGYLYQVRYALKLLLSEENPHCQISMERFDDVAFSQSDTPIQMIQLKHHVSRQGDLSDSSTDIWRTLNVWMDAVSENESLLSDTEFLIITTASTPNNSAASFLRTNERNISKAYEKLKHTADTSTSEKNRLYYQAFSSFGIERMHTLLSKIKIIDGASNILDVTRDLYRIIRYSCLPQFEERIRESIEGWWFQKSIEALCSASPIFITQQQVRSLVVSISQQYADDNLPIDVWDYDTLTKDDLGPDERVFFEQLKLICISNKHLNIAIRDYYRAFMQRAQWIRNGLLFINDLEEYEQRLIDEWEHLFAHMEDKLSIMGTQVTEEDKVTYGKELLSKIEMSNVLIRPKVKEAFIMRGSYHILANQLKVGWHIDFQERLTHLLSISKGGGNK